MAAKFELKIDEAQLSAVKAAVSEIKNGYETVMKNAINRTLSTVQTQAVARIANDLNLPSARIKEDFYIRNATVSKIGGGVYSTGKPVGLYSFGAVDNMSGVKVRVKKASSAKIINHTFIATTKHAKAGDVKNVYWREWNKFRTRWNINRRYAKLPDKYRFKIERRTGPRIEDIYAGDSVFEPVTIQAQTLFVQRVDEEVTELFRKIAATGNV
jgi:hypothetical protein